MGIQHSVRPLVLCYKGITLWLIHLVSVGNVATNRPLQHEDLGKFGRLDGAPMLLLHS